MQKISQTDDELMFANGRQYRHSRIATDTRYIGIHSTHGVVDGLGY